MKLIPNQPVIFDQVIDDCHLNYTRYKQKVKLGDVTNFQIGTGDCPLPENKVVNGGFATDLSGWSQQAGSAWQAIGGKACNTNPANQFLSQSSLIAGRFYRVEVTVTDLVSTDTSDVNSGKLVVLLGLNPVGIISQNGTYVFYGVCLFVGEVKFSKRANTEVCIDDITALEINIDHIIAIYTENDVFVLSLKVSDFIDETAEITDEFSLIQNFLTTFIDWSALAVPAGCYKICLLDSCVNTNFQNYLPNGEFSVVSTSAFTEWTYSSIFLFVGGGLMTYFGDVTLGTANASQVGILNGASYEVEVQINTIADCKVWVQFGTQKSTEWTTTGLQTDTVIADGTTIAIHFEGINGPALPEAQLDFVRIKIGSESFVVDFCSPVFDLRASHDCTLRLNACDDPRLVDDMGFLFKETGFNPTIRLHSKLVNSQYDFPERDINVNSFGKRQVVYYERVKLKTLKISKQPEYVHDFISLLFGFDHFSIENQEYNVESEEYVLTYDNEDDFARVAIDVAVKEELIRNSLCLNEGDTGPCQIDDNFLTDPETGDAITEPDGGDEVAIPG